MFKYVHHIHYLVNDRDAMVAYLEKNFGLKPTRVFDDEKNKRKEANYDLDKTQMQMVEPTDPSSTQGQHLKKHGPGVYHVAWAVDNLRELLPDLTAKGNRIYDIKEAKPENGFLMSARGYLHCNIDPASSEGVWFQLVGEG